MQILLVRHGESEGNAQGRMQGHKDYELTELGRQQATTLGRWLKSQGLKWDAAYCSPLARASTTFELVRAETGAPEAERLDDLREIDNGRLSDMNRDEIVKEFPSFMERPVDKLGDFGEFGGESYDDVQARVQRVRALFDDRHREAGQRILVVAHGGLNFQLTKSIICLPVPKVCILRFGNCCATQLKLRERRGVWMGEVSWHVPVELMGGTAQEGDTKLFR